MGEMKNIIKGWDPIEESVFAEGGPKLAGLRTDVISGDLDFDPLGLCPEESKIFLDLRTRELNNGRLAMIAALGMLVQEKFVTGQPIFENPTTSAFFISITSYDFNFYLNE